MRAEAILKGASARAVREEGLPLRLADVVITSAAMVAVLLVVVLGRWMPGWWRSALAFLGIAVGAPLLRGLALRFPKARVFDFLASVWILPAAGIGHFHLGPLVDAVHPRLLDKYLYLADVRLFGTTPSVVLGRYVHGVFLDGVMVCYYGYFLWMTVLALLLYRRAERAALDRYVLALTLCFAANFACYVFVPAIGPRYFLAYRFDGALPGGWLTAYLDSMMRNPAFARDCFPSGHTAGTLTVLTYAFRHHRRFFWGLLPAALGLILATLAGRFHYAIDLVCAVPLVVTAVSASTALCRARPRGVVVPALAFTFRSPLGA